MTQFLIFIAFAIVAAAYWVGSRPTTSLDAETLKTMEKFSLPDFKTGKEVHLADYRGQLMVVNFWASWCPPCVEEMPGFLAFSEWAARDLGVKVFAVSVDERPENIAELFAEKKLWGRRDLPFSVLLDAGAKISNRYGTVKYPETYVLDGNFRLLRKFEGPQDWASKEIRRWFESLREH